MGRQTYQQLLEWGRLCGDGPTFVLTSATHLAVPDGANVTFRSAPTAKAIAGRSAQTPKRLWVFGGGNVVTVALLGGVVNTLGFTIMPEALGEKIPLFSEPYPSPMRIIHSVPYDNGAVRLVHDTTTARTSWPVARSSFCGYNRLSSVDRRLCSRSPQLEEDS
jgi:dihydrofolate reductase